MGSTLDTSLNTDISRSKESIHIKKYSHDSKSVSNQTKINTSDTQIDYFSYSFSKTTQNHTSNNVILIDDLLFLIKNNNLNLKDYDTYTTLSLFGLIKSENGNEVSVFLKDEFSKSLISNKNFLEADFEKGIKETFLKLDKFLISNIGNDMLKASKIENSELFDKEECHINDLKLEKISDLLFLKNDFSENEYPVSYYTSSTISFILVVINQKEHVYYIVNLGTDSIFHIQKDKVKPMNRVHNIENPNEKMRILKANGEETLSRLSSTRAFGKFEYKAKEHLSIEKQVVIVVPEIVKVKESKESKENEECYLIGSNMFTCLVDNEIQNKYFNFNTLSQSEGVIQMVDDVQKRNLDRNSFCFIVLKKKS